MRDMIDVLVACSATAVIVGIVFTILGKFPTNPEFYFSLAAVFGVWSIILQLENIRQEAKIAKEIDAAFEAKRKREERTE